MLTDGQAEVPERLEQRADEAFVARRHRVLEQNQEIDVRVQAERPAPITAERAERERGARVDAGILGQLLDERVDPAGIAGLDLPTGPAMPGGSGVFLTSVAKHRARRRLVPFGA